MGLLSRLAGAGAAAAAATASVGLQMLPLGYHASRLGRRVLDWNPERRTINAMLASGGDQLRARSRQLCRENPYAINAQEAFVAAAIGVGIKPSLLSPDAALKANVQKTWLAWTDEADADGLTDFYGLQTLACRAMFEAGECFLRFRPRKPKDGFRVPLQLQLLESEQLDFTLNRPLANGHILRCGIEFNPLGQRVAYHFFKVHPGDRSLGDVSNIEKTIVPASEVLHLYRPLRPGQIRGQPALTPAMVRLYLLDQYDDAELDRKKVAAMFAGFVTKAAPDGPDPLPAEPVLDDSTSLLAPLEPGMMQVLLPGESITFSSPSEVGGSYEAFQYRNLLSIASAVGLPYHAISSDAGKANYSSLRSTQVEFRRRMDQFQHQTMVFQLCRPVWRRWFETAVLADAIKGLTPARFQADPAGIAAAKWIPPKWDWVDPLKDRQAQALAEDRGWIARSDSIEAEGYDPEEVDLRIKADQDRADKLGIQILAKSEMQKIDADAEAAKNPPAAGTAAA
jgi:lambda family phage portal protein